MKKNSNTRTAGIFQDPEKLEYDNDIQMMRSSISSILISKARNSPLIEEDTISSEFENIEKELEKKVEMRKRNKSTGTPKPIISQKGVSTTENNNSEEQTTRMEQQNNIKAEQKEVNNSANCTASSPRENKQGSEKREEVRKMTKEMVKKLKGKTFRFFQRQHSIQSIFLNDKKKKEKELETKMVENGNQETNSNKKESAQVKETTKEVKKEESSSQRNLEALHFSRSQDDVSVGKKTYNIDPFQQKGFQDLPDTSLYYSNYESFLELLCTNHRCKSIVDTCHFLFKNHFTAQL